MIVNIVVNGQTNPVDINDIINKDITSDLFEFKEDLENILPNSENKIIYQKNKNFICLFEGKGIRKPYYLYCLPDKEYNITYSNSRENAITHYMKFKTKNKSEGTIIKNVDNAMKYTESGKDSVTSTSSIYYELFRIVNSDMDKIMLSSLINKNKNRTEKSIKIRIDYGYFMLINKDAVYMLNENHVKRLLNEEVDMTSSVDLYIQLNKNLTKTNRTVFNNVYNHLSLCWGNSNEKFYKEQLKLVNDENLGESEVIRLSNFFFSLESNKDLTVNFSKREELSQLKINLIKGIMSYDISELTNDTEMIRSFDKIKNSHIDIINNANTISNIDLLIFMDIYNIPVSEISLNI